MKWRIVVVLPAVVLPLVVGACTVTPEFVRAALCVPAEPEVPAEPGGLLQPVPSDW